MFEQLIEAISTFSFRSVLRTNIISSSGSSFGSTYSPMSLGTGLGNNSPSRALSNNQLLSSYYLKLQELKDYQYSELTNIVLGIYEDYLLNYFNNGDEVVQLADDVKNKDVMQLKLNTIIKQLDLVGEIKSHLREYLYNGSYAVKVTWDEAEAVYRKYTLANPSSVITVSSSFNVIPDSYLVVSREGTIYQVSPYSIAKFGASSLHLINDVNADYFESDEDTLIKGVDISAGFPLYYNISDKVKEYLLKDQIITLLSIKDLVQPLLLLLRVDNNTSPDEANKLALNVENLINKYSDISAIMGTNFSITDLIDSLINNIRVLPDYLSGMGDMNNLDLSKLSNKIAEIRGDQDTTKETILNGMAIPRSLYSGDSTKWDAIKSSQRLNSRINHYVTDLTDSMRDIVVMLYKMITNEDLSRDSVNIRLFKKTEADYNTEITNADVINTLLDQINRILDNVPRVVRDNELVDPEAYCNYVKNKLLAIDPEIESIIPEQNIKKYVNQLIQQRMNQDSGESGFGSRFR